MDITSAFQGLSTTLPELYTLIGDLGWSVHKVRYDKKLEQFVAIAKSPTGEEIKKTGTSDKAAVANLLLAVTRRQHTKTSAQQKLSAWKYTFVDEQKEIAEAYVKAPLYDPQAAIAFKELADDCMHRALVLQQHIQVQIIPNPEPYTDPEKMAQDVRKRRKLIVSNARIEHPIWIPEQVIAFRICFDILGYVAAGSGWDWKGDNEAFQNFAPLVSANAQEALFTEVIGQGAYRNRFKAYGPQKIAILPRFVEVARETEGVHPKFQGIHPSLSVPPVETPKLEPFKHLDKDAPYPLPDDGPIGLQPISAAEPGLADPNSAWQSGISPMQPNAYLDHGDPLEFQTSMDNAKKIDTEWAEFKTGDKKPDYERMKQAIVNAFRAVLLSPRKELKWNAIHYQDISHIPASVDDPAVYWNALEKARQDWNIDRFGEQARFAHMPYYKFLPQFQSVIAEMNRNLDPKGVIDKTQKIMQKWLTEEQNKVLAEDEQKGKQRSSDEVERIAVKEMTARMKNFIKERQLALDVPEGYHEAAQEQLFEPEEQPGVEVVRYGAFMGTHLKAIAQISNHADDILKAALEDVHNHDGSGHHFRAAVLQMNIPGVGPKVCSFAWLLLQPMTSELATIDVHMMNMLNHNYEKEMTPREYSRFERELAAGRDAAGYGHMPLGAFQWTMWDNRRTGEGSHSDHSALRAVDPVPFDKVEWHPLLGQSATNPDWWENTKPLREQVGQEWLENEAKQVPQNKIPFKRLNPAFSKVAKTKEQFEHQWKERKPIHMDDAKILGEYAAGAHLSEDEAEEYVEAHQSDVKVDFPNTFFDFKEAYLSNYRKFKVSKVGSTLRTPWLLHPATGKHILGQPGETLMSHAVKTLGLTTPQVWEQLQEAGKV